MRQTLRSLRLNQAKNKKLKSKTMKKLFKIFKILILVIVVFIIAIVLFINLHPTFGDSPNAESMARINKSENFDGEHFKNLINTNATTMGISKSKRKINRWALLKNFMFPPEGKNPKKIKSKKMNAKHLKNGQLVWLGHSTVLFKTNNTTIITDPVFHNAAPVSFAVAPFEMTNTPKMEDLPFIDAVLISHDHYDHLDYKAIKHLKSKVGHFYVPLGVKAHLLHWGVADDKVSEYDWYEATNLNDIKLVFTPSRHFSGRGILNHRETLWGSWVVIAPDIKIYFSGDGGYSPEFAKIGQQFSGFDMAFMEDGAYNESWQQVHMLPEQTAQACIDVQAKVVLPIHWAKFDLSTHKWNEPVKRLSEALRKHNDTVAEQKQIQLATPSIGQVFSLDTLPQLKWWEENSYQLLTQHVGYQASQVFKTCEVSLTFYVKKRA